MLDHLADEFNARLVWTVGQHCDFVPRLGHDSLLSRCVRTDAGRVDQLPFILQIFLDSLDDDSLQVFGLNSKGIAAAGMCIGCHVVATFSRYVVGWLIADRENSDLAEQLIVDTVERHNVERGMLTLHADRGARMRSKAVADLLVDLDVAKSHSRPYVSDDNPFSEAQFKTLKYRPDFPARFDCLADARAFCQQFFAGYNDQHQHSGIGYMTPHSVHYGTAQAIHATRQALLSAGRPTHLDPIRRAR